MRKISILVLIISVALVGVVYALSVSQTVPDVQVRDSRDRPVAIPDLGSKVVTVFYYDTLAADFTDPIATALKDKDYPKEKYRSQVIANIVDSSGVPDWLIRRIFRKKEKKLDIKILNDPNHLLKNAWNLGNCKDIGVVIVIGKDRVVRHISYVKSVAHGRSLVNTIVGVVEAEFNNKLIKHEDNCEAFMGLCDAECASPAGIRRRNNFSKNSNTPLIQCEPINYREMYYSLISTAQDDDSKFLRDFARKACMIVCPYAMRKYTGN